MRKNYVETIFVLNEVDNKVKSFYKKMLLEEVITLDDIESLGIFLEKKKVKSCVCSLKEVFELIRIRYEYVCKLQEIIEKSLVNIPESETSLDKIVEAITEIKEIFDSIKLVFEETRMKPIVVKTLSSYYKLLIYATDQKSRIDMVSYVDALKRSEYFVSKLLGQGTSKEFEIENLDRILYSANVFDFTTIQTVNSYLRGSTKKLVIAFEEAEGILSYLLARYVDNKLMIELVRNDSSSDKPEIFEYDNISKLQKKLQQINCNILYDASKELE